MGKLQITVIEPEDLAEFIPTNYPNLVHIKKSVTKKNMKKLVGDLLDENTILIDTSVNVDSISLMKICKNKKSLFINTSIEEYCEGDDYGGNRKIDKVDEKENLYARGMEAEKLLKNSKVTMLHSNGANPGLVNSFVFQALEDYTKMYGDKECKKLLKEKKFNLLARKLGLYEINISEIDDQITSIQIEENPNIFFCTWSAIGFQEEGADPAQVVGDWSNDKKFIKSKLEEHVYYSKERGMNLMTNSICLDFNGKPVEYEGYIVSHYEPFSLARYLCSKEYCPKIYYVYKPAPIVVQSLDLFRKNKYEIMDGYVLKGYDIVKGSDNVGCTLYFENGKKWWIGTCLNISQTKRLGFQYSGPTTVQVAISMTVAMNYILHNAQHKGLITSEEIPYGYMIKNCKKYLGNVYSKEI